MVAAAAVPATEAVAACTVTPPPTPATVTALIDPPSDAVQEVNSFAQEV
jgi:hypothetical protein